MKSALQGLHYPAYIMAIFLLALLVAWLVALLRSRRVAQGRSETAWVWSFLAVNAVILFNGMVMLLYFYVPKFKAIFQEMNAALPMLTKILLMLSDGVHHHWYYLLGPYLLMNILTMWMIVFFILESNRDVKPGNRLSDVIKVFLLIFVPLLIIGNLVIIAGLYGPLCSVVSRLSEIG